ncbi:MAG: metal-dependent hydrolase [Nanoarchaeota archaeon]
MLSRTHFVIGLLFVMIFLPSTSHPWIFSFAMIISSLIPDIDSPMSLFGKNKVFSPLQSLVNHRGLIHSLTLAFILSLLLSLIFPSAALGFFLGYSIHLLADSFTIEGVSPFWPLRGRISWKLKTGGYFENAFFVVISLFDILLIIRHFS